MQLMKRTGSCDAKYHFAMSWHFLDDFCFVWAGFDSHFDFSYDLHVSLALLLLCDHDPISISIDLDVWARHELQCSIAISPLLP